MSDGFAFPFPLPTLLGRVQALYTAEYDQAIGELGLSHLSLSLGTNVMRHLDVEHGTRLSMLVDASGVSKQAISQQVAHLERHGYVTIEPDPSDSRAKLVRLTPSGEASRATSRTAFEQMERAWRDRFGAEEIRTLRRVLEQILLKTGDTDVAPAPKAGGRTLGP